MACPGDVPTPEPLAAVTGPQPVECSMRQNRVPRAATRSSPGKSTRRAEQGTNSVSESQRAVRAACIAGRTVSPRALT